MENNTILLVEEAEKENAKALAQSFIKSEIRGRAYTNALGAEVCINYLRNEGLISDASCNLHNIRRILEEFDIADIILPNIRIDVRVVYDENCIFVPKSHFEYNLTPDIYVVLKISKDYSQTEFLGFFEPKMLNQNNANDEYYFMEKEKLSAPVDLKNFIQNYEGKADKDYAERTVDNAQMIMVSMADHNVSDDDKRKLLGYLKNSSALRDRFIEFENFEMLAYKSANEGSAVSEISEESMNINGDITLDDLNIDGLDDIQEGIEEPLSDITIDEISDTEEVLGSTTNEVFDTEKVESVTDTESGTIGDMLKGAAIMGAEIAGAAVASAALSGAAEGAEIVSNAADAAGEVTDVATDITDTISQISNSNKEDEIKADIDIEKSNVEGSSDSEILMGNLDDLDLFENNDEESAGINFDNLSAEIDNLDDNELKFNDNQDDFGDIVFENNDFDDIQVTNNNVSDGNFGSKPAISTVVNTPISEATDLISMENIKLGNIPPLDIPKNIDIEMDTMEIDEFHKLVNDYVPQKIEDESVTVDYDTVSQENPNNTFGNSISDDINSDKFVEDIADIAESVNLTQQEAEVSDEVQEAMLSDLVDNTEKKEESVSENITLPENTVEDNNNFESLIDDISSVNELKEPEENILDTSNVNTEDIFDELASVENISLSEENNLIEGSAIKEDLPEAEKTLDEIGLSLDEQNNNEDNLNSDLIEANLDDISDFELSEQDIVEEKIPETSVSVPNEESLFDDISDISEDKIENIAEENLTLADSTLNNISEENVKITDEVLPMAEEIISEEKAGLSLNGLEDISSVEDIPAIDDIETDSESLGILYNGSEPTEISSEIQEEYEDYDFRPKKTKVMPIFATTCLILIMAVVVGLMIKNKNSIDSDSIIQSTADNSTLAGPETDNSGILADNEIHPAIPTENMAPSDPAPKSIQEQEPAAQISKEAKQEAVKNTKEAIKKTNEAIKKQQETVSAPKKPLNASKTITLQRVSWEVPDYLSYSDNMRKYLQTAGKSIKLTLASDLLLTNDYIYSNQVKVNLKLTKDGIIESSQIAKSSGSTQVDKIVLQTVKDTLNVVKPARGEVPTPNFNLGIIIYL